MTTATVEGTTFVHRAFTQRGGLSSPPRLCAWAGRVSTGAGAASSLYAARGQGPLRVPLPSDLIRYARASSGRGFPATGPTHRNPAPTPQIRACAI